MKIQRIEQETPHYSSVIKDELAGIVERIGDTPVRIDVPEYDGEYKVRSSAHDEKVLMTRGKLMNDNVTVMTISYWETSNPDGTTVYIGVD